MALNRRQFLQLAAGTTLYGVMRGGALAQAASDPGVMWAQVLADGGMDNVLFCDPKLGLRSGLTQQSQIGSAGVFQYCNLDPKVGEFFQAHYARMLVFNGVDTGTNNHEVGVRFSMVGSSNTGYPIFAAQVAAAHAEGRPMPLIDVSGYDEAGDLLAPTRIDYHNIEVLESLKHPNARDSGTFASAGARARVLAAHKARLERLAEKTKLPSASAGIDQLRKARVATTALETLDSVEGSSEESVIELGIKAYAKGLAVSLTCSVNGFDTHAGTGGDSEQSLHIGALIDRVRYILDTATANNVPAIVVVCSDFGRSPHYDGGGGTDHWPNSSIVIVQNALAAAKQVLPGNALVGGSTQALQPMKLNPATLALDSAGALITPGHVYRALRRAAKIDTHEVLKRFPLSIVGSDLTLG